ncbi:NAD/NADP octopine/nopaline dehydrogenase family protein [Anaerosalibacter massiliensis]|uniref:NAD/NADP octopine/nopaline dehydrogenase family protein n=1 Tax=Anaerosalibacter massiliensis TaxID=1347392 RepID=A0A9X2S8H6_9FIRM|nr:NAD/NADP octopine/nopaline dehydrogenase family protein [Anaerosalibacter massiliensis]MCR2045136.1 NAD/NADP octopine/nopaline dehydrogenase family protein [Anaerosalibacter massiliensis]
MVGFKKGDAKGFKCIKAPNTLEHRHLNEDVGYGLVFMTDL